MKAIYTVIALGIIVIDQITKWIANSELALHEQIPVMPSFNLTLMYNHGAAFSFLSEAGGWQRWFFTVVASIISIVLVVWIYRLKSDEKWLGIALSMILGGAIGNLIDRVMFGYVIDFIQWFIQWNGSNIYWPAFNIADAAICVGTVLLLATSFFESRDEKNAGTL